MKLTLIELDDPAAKNPGLEIISQGVYLSEDVPEGINPVNNTGALSVYSAGGSRWQCVANSAVSTCINSAVLK